MLKGRIKTSVQKSNSGGIGTVGKVKIGETRKSAKTGKNYPVSLDYFIPYTSQNYVKMFNHFCGEKPNVLQICFISDDITHACNEQLELRDKSGKLYAKSDGQTYFISDGKGNWIIRTVDELLEKYGTLESFNKTSAAHCGSQKGWEVRLTIRFLIPKIKGLLGEWELSTKGEASSIKQITSAFDSVLESAGTVKMIPFDLVVKKVKSDKSGVSTQYPVIQLIPNISTENLALLAEFTGKGLPTFRYGALTDNTIMALKEASEASDKSDVSGIEDAVIIQ